MLNKVFIILLLPLVLMACTNPKKVDSIALEWPSDIPKLSYYQNLYSQDTHNQAAQSEDDYLMWVKRFYKGWAGFSRGWLEVSDELVEGINSDRQVVVKEKLAVLGKEVSGEWAKKSDQRLIYSKNLSIWGNVLSEASYQENVESVIDHISEDVDLMMAKQLEPDAITMKRYFPNLDMEQEFSMF